MQFLEWKETYSVKVPEIDQQHRRLVGIINDLHETLMQGGDPDQVLRVLNDLVAYTQYHFRFEEQMMERAGYPATEDHKRVHRAMEGQVEKFHAEVVAHKAGAPLKLAAFLKDWLNKHILETDMRYSGYLNRRRVA
jgi:hemerythrin